MLVSVRLPFIEAIVSHCNHAGKWGAARGQGLYTHIPRPRRFRSMLPLHGHRQCGHDAALAQPWRVVCGFVRLRAGEP